MTTHLIDCDAYGDRLIESPTITAALADNRILSVTPQLDGRFRVAEMCDDYFHGLLTPAQLHAWADELHRIADGLPPVDTGAASG